MLTGLLSRARNAKRRAGLEAQLASPPCPNSLRHLWNIYLRLRRRKGSNGFGPSPIEWGDIAAFLSLTQIRLAPCEIETIELLDDCFLQSPADKEPE